MAQNFQADRLDDSGGLTGLVQRLNQLFRKLEGTIGRVARFRTNRNVSAATTAVDSDDLIRVDTTVAGRTITLPDPKTVLGRSFVVKMVAGANSTTVQSAGGANIDAAATKVWSVLNDAYEFTAVQTGTATFRWDITNFFSSAAGGSGYNLIQDEGIGLTARSTINFIGAGVTAADSGAVTTVTIPGGSGNSVTTTVDFGASFTDKAQTVVTGQAWVTANSEIIAQPLTPAGVDPDEMRLLDLDVVISDLVAGTGFTVTVYSESEAKGTYDIMCVGV